MSGSDGPGEPLSGGIQLYGAFVEGSYLNVHVKPEAPNSDRSKTYGGRIGAMFVVPKYGLLVIPSISYRKEKTEGSNRFATIDSNAKIWGGELNVVLLAGPGLTLNAGGSVGSGPQHLVFNNYDRSRTGLDSYAGHAGADYTIYRKGGFSASVGDEVGYAYLLADFDPTNSVDRGVYRSWSNEVRARGSWTVTRGTDLTAGMSWISRFGLHEIVGEPPHDREFAILSAGFSQAVSDRVSLYGNVRQAAFNSSRSSTFLNLGILTRF